MDGILALGHFCETHGPCVVLSTQKKIEEPIQGPHSLEVPWCEACQSLQLDQALVSREDGYCYVTTRSPLEANTAILLRQATVRSLSCEQEGTLYFGDSERAHVFSHSFTVHDSLARGFQRKYTILMLMQDRIHLLNKWPFLLKHIKEIAKTLRDYSADINEIEQEQRPQRAVRQAQNSPSSSGRSLSQLTGKPAIYAHIHMWFAWLLGCQIIVEMPFKSTLPIPKPSSFLRTLFQDMGEMNFKKVCSLLIIGVPLKSNDSQIILTMQSLLPSLNFTAKLNQTHYCNIYKECNQWYIESDIQVPTRLSTFQIDVTHALKDCSLSESALEPQLSSIIMHWLHISKVLTWCPQIDLKLLQSLNVVKYDVQLLIFWTANYADCDKHRSIVRSLNNIYNY